MKPNEFFPYRSLKEYDEMRRRVRVQLWLEEVLANQQHQAFQERCRKEPNRIHYVDEELQALIVDAQNFLKSE